jgi:hypothetical protein
MPVKETDSEIFIEKTIKHQKGIFGEGMGIK